MIRMRELSEAERQMMVRWSQSRTEPARRVERAKIIRLASEGQSVLQIARSVGMSANSVRLWMKRFLAAGMTGLEDAPRSGAPPRYTAEVKGLIIATALTPPLDLGQSFASWTYERLTTYLSEQRGVRMKKTRIFEVLEAEGLRWRQQETWFGERVDPDFAAKRGHLKH